MSKRRDSTAVKFIVRVILHVKFPHTPACFFHNPDEIGKQAWEIRGHFPSNTSERTGALSKAWKESELQEHKARANYTGKKHQFYGTQDHGVCAIGIAAVKQFNRTKRITTMKGMSKWQTWQWSRAFTVRCQTSKTSFVQ